MTQEQILDSFEKKMFPLGFDKVHYSIRDGMGSIILQNKRAMEGSDEENIEASILIFRAPNGQEGWDVGSHDEKEKAMLEDTLDALRTYYKSEIDEVFSLGSVSRKSDLKRNDEEIYF